MIRSPLILALAAAPLLAAEIREASLVDAGAIPAAQYVQANADGHLERLGQRIKFWAVIGNFPNQPGLQSGDDAASKAAKIARSRADTDALVERFDTLGFNMSRFWRYNERDYQFGDGSEEDTNDYFIYKMKERGMHIWVPGVSGIDATPADVTLHNDPATAEAWVAAIKEWKEQNKGMTWIARVWDPRMEAAQVAGMQRRTGHVNRYTGLRWGDDPVFAIWELTNEEWWITKMMAGAWRGLPQFFQNSLRQRWTAFLATKYGTEAKLVARWGFLLPGESLTSGTIGLLPMADPAKLGDAGMDPTAKAALVAAGGNVDLSVSRNDLSRRRGEDLIEFYISLQQAHKQRLATALKGMGRSTKLAPLVYDTGIGYQVQSQYLQQSADAVAHDAYIDGWTRVPENQRAPWLTGLEEYPRISMDVPWLEHNKVAGKPYFCYETQIQQPAKYRAEFPLRILALASIQDWDAVCWHYWGASGDISTSPKPFDRALDNNVGGHPQGYHYTFDEVQAAMMRSAGLAFRGDAVKPAPKPTTFTFGRSTLLDPDSMDYGSSYGRLGQHMLYTTYQHGVRIKIDPTREDDTVDGPLLRLDGQGIPAIISPNAQITFDTLQANLRFDSPALRAFTGFLAHVGGSWTFKEGTVLSDVSIDVPKNMPYPEGIADELYLGFALGSTDGKPLAETKSATCSLVSTSFNTGFKLENNDGKLHGTQSGTLPVLVARVAGTVTDRALAGMTWRFRDWHNVVLKEGVIGADGKLRIPSDLPVWYVELTR